MKGKQECIPVGCVPPALYRTAGGVFLQGGLCPGGLCPGGSLSGWVSVQRGLCLRGSLSRGVSVRGSPWQRPPVNIITTLPCPNFVAGGKNGKHTLFPSIPLTLFFEVNFNSVSFTPVFRVDIQTFRLISLFSTGTGSYPIVEQLVSSTDSFPDRSFQVFAFFGIVLFNWNMISFFDFWFIFNYCCKSPSWWHFQNIFAQKILKCFTVSPIWTTSWRRMQFAAESIFLSHIYW